ncbi:alpha/beta fold hydrolase [Streptomyces sp. NPDC001373]|uniref:alpha/beta fold hydrolase n=1 Tax=Streptomyces sp. NPDC001373 TaxID=3364565 RepID=UPI0036873D74
MDEKTTAPHRQPACSPPDTPPGKPRGRRSRSRRRRITVLAVGVLTALLTLNAVSVLTQSADASGGHLVHIPGGDLNVVQDGPPDAPTVVLIHGLGGSTSWWAPVLPALRDLHVVRVDLLGHGGSAKPANGYGIADQSRRVGTALDRLGVRRAIVVGHSTGGAVATSLAEQRSDLVAAIALIDAGPRLDAYIGGSFVDNLVTTPVVGQLIWRLRTDGTVRAALSTAFTRKVAVPDRIVSDIQGMTYRSLTATDEASSAYLKERPLPDRLAGLGLPTLVIFGSRDRRWQPSSAQDYRRVPNARIVILEGVGHTPMFEDPDATGSLLHGFAAEDAPH